MIKMKKRIVLIALSVLALGSVGTILSTFYSQDEMTNFTGWQATHKVSYGIPLGWHGYSELVATYMIMIVCFVAECS